MSSKKTKTKTEKVVAKLSKNEKKLAEDIQVFEQDEKEIKKDAQIFEDMNNVFIKAGFRDFVNYLNSPGRIAWSNFLAGIFRGLGIIMGMTIVFAAILWMISNFVNFPLIGSYFQDLVDLLEGFSPATKFR